VFALPSPDGIVVKRAIILASHGLCIYVSEAFLYVSSWKAPIHACTRIRAELGPTGHTIETSNRRFRDDEFLVGRDLTHGRKTIRARIVFDRVNRPLFPGGPVHDQAWSEIKYTAYSFVVAKNRR
jgi:hypothetical protein